MQFGGIDLEVLCDFFCCCCCFVVVFLGLHLQHVEVPRLGVKSELQMLAIATATAMQDLSRVCDLHHSSWPCWILNPLSEVRDGTLILVDTSWVCFCRATMGTPGMSLSIVPISQTKPSSTRSPGCGHIPGGQAVTVQSEDQLTSLPYCTTSSSIFFILGPHPCPWCKCFLNTTLLLAP